MYTIPAENLVECRFRSAPWLTSGKSPGVGGQLTIQPSSRLRPDSNSTTLAAVSLVQVILDRERERGKQLKRHLALDLFRYQPRKRGNLSSSEETGGRGCCWRCRCCCVGWKHYSMFSSFCRRPGFLLFAHCQQSPIQPSDKHPVDSVGNGESERMSGSNLNLPSTFFMYE